MFEDKDVWLMATRLVANFGIAAPSRATMRANELREQGDADGGEIWQRVHRAVVELLRGEPDGPLH